MSRPLGLALSLAIVIGLVLWLVFGPGASVAEREPVGRKQVTPFEGEAATGEPASSAPNSTAGSNRTVREAEDVFHERMAARHGEQDLQGLRKALQVLNLEFNVALVQNCQPRVAAQEAPLDDGRAISVDTVHYRGVDGDGVMRLVVLEQDELPALQATHREVRWLAREIERRGDSR